MDLRSQLLVILAAASSLSFPQEIPVESPLVTTQPLVPSTSTPPDLPPPPVNVTETKVDLLEAQQPVQVNLTSQPTPPLGPALGASCNETEVCQAEDSSCKNSKCTCNEGFVQSKFNPKCLKVVKVIGGDCYESGQCIVDDLATSGPWICLNFKCSCDIGWAYDSFNNVCHQPSELDTVCNTTDDCSIPNSFCSNSICTCLANYVPAPDNTACTMMLRLKSEGDACSEDADCQKTLGELAVCSLDVENGRCKCPRGTTFGNEQGICAALSDAASSNSLSLLLLGLMFLTALTSR